MIERFLCLMAISWLMQESLGLNSDWFDETRLLSSKKLHISLKLVFQRFFHKLRTNEMGGNFSGLIYHLFMDRSNVSLFTFWRKQTNS